MEFHMVGNSFKKSKHNLYKESEKIRKYFLSLSWVQNAFDDDLECACCIVSKILYDHLKSKGFNVSFIEGIFDNGLFSSVDDEPNHCWLEVENKWIVDLTATQFGDYDPIHIIPISDDEEYSLLLRDEDAFAHIKEYWPSEQQPVNNISIPNEI